MAPLAFNGLLDRWKHRFLSFLGDTELLYHVLRGTVFYKDFSLTAAQMDTLNATPVSLLAAPGAGLCILVNHIHTRIFATGFTRFELGSGVLEYRYTDGSGVQVATDVPNTQVESATDTAYQSVGLAGVPVDNAAIVAKASADVTSGTGNVKGRIYYRVIKVAELTT